MNQPDLIVYLVIALLPRSCYKHSACSLSGVAQAPHFLSWRHASSSICSYNQRSSGLTSAFSDTRFDLKSRQFLCNSPRPSCTFYSLQKDSRALCKFLWSFFLHLAIVTYRYDLLFSRSTTVRVGLATFSSFLALRFTSI